MNWYTKRSLLQLHILFLGLFVEPYRNYVVDLAKFHIGDITLESEQLEGWKHIEEQCILAARQCARVASLLQLEKLIRSRCWVSVYTSFSSCGILLLSASQKLLMLCGDACSEDLLYASSHLDVLSFCSYENDMMTQLYTTLRIIFNDIREIVASSVYRTMRELDFRVVDAAKAPSHHVAIEGAANGAVDVSRTIVDVNRRIIGVLQERLIY